MSVVPSSLSSIYLLKELGIGIGALNRFSLVTLARWALDIFIYIYLYLFWCLFFVCVFLFFIVLVVVFGAGDVELMEIHFDLLGVFFF